MKRVYLVAPVALLIAFISYERWSASGRSDGVLRLSGETPRLWKQVDAIKPAAVRLVSGDEFEDRDGAQDAAKDLRSGRLVMLRYGMDLPWEREYAEVWAERYGVEVRAIAGCSVSESVLRYAADYGRVMSPHIAQRFGADVFRGVSEEARALHERRMSEKANQSLEPTTLLGTSAAAQPLVPSTVVAHL